MKKEELKSGMIVQTTHNRFGVVEINKNNTDNMKTEDIPYDYTYCYATDEQCPKAVHCLCSHAARLNEEQAISLNSRFTGDQKRHPRLN
mgnify:CR=1 FL=1